MQLTATPPTGRLIPENRCRKMIRDVLRQAGATGDQVSQVDDAIDDVRAAGIDWGKLFAVLLPIIISLLSGEPLDIAAIIKLILSILTG